MAAYGTQIGFTVAGLGVGVTSRLVHFMSGPAPSWDSDAAWCPCVPWQRFPGQLSSRISFRDGSSSIGGMSFEASAGGALASGLTAAQMLYDLSPVSLGTLEASFAASDATVNTDNTGIAGITIMVGATGECIALDSHVATGTYNVSRARFGTRAQRFDLDTMSAAFYNSALGPSLLYRRIQYVRVVMDTATSYSDIEVLWTGVVVGVSRPSPGLLKIDADALLSMLQGRKILTSPWRGHVTPPGSGEPRRSGTATITTHTTGYTVTGRTRGAPRGTLFSLGGKALVKVTLSEISGGVYGGAFGPSRQVRFDEFRDPPMPSDGGEMWEVHHHTGTTDTALPYSENLATCFLQVMLSTREGNNGSEDLGGDVAGDEDFGLGVPNALVDVAGIKQIRARLGEHLVQTRNFFNEKGDGVKVLEWFRERLWPFGIAICQKAGTIGWALFADNAQTTTATLTEAADILGPSAVPPQTEPAHTRVMDLAFDSVRAEYAHIPGAGTISDTFVDAARRALHPYADQSAPLAHMAGEPRQDRVSLLVSSLLQRFHDDIGRVSMSVRRTSGEAVDVGDLVLVTHSSMPSSALGARGVTSQAFLIESKEEDVASNATRIEALDVGALYDNTGLLAPALVVASYEIGTPAQVVFQVNRAGGGYQSGLLTTTIGAADDDDLLAGDKLDHCDSRGVVRQAGLVVLNVGSGVVDFTTPPSTPPIAGDVFRVSSYDTASARQTARYAFHADTSGYLGAGNAPGKQYTAF